MYWWCGAELPVKHIKTWRTCEPNQNQPIKNLLDGCGSEVNALMFLIGWWMLMETKSKGREPQMLGPAMKFSVGSGKRTNGGRMLLHSRKGYAKLHKQERSASGIPTQEGTSGRSSQDPPTAALVRCSSFCVYWKKTSKRNIPTSLKLILKWRKHLSNPSHRFYSSLGFPILIVRWFPPIVRLFSLIV